MFKLQPDRRPIALCFYFRRHDYCLHSEEAQLELFKLPADERKVALNEYRKRWNLSDEAQALFDLTE